MAKKPRINTGKKRKPMTLAHRKAIGRGLARVKGDTTDYDPYEKKGRKPGKASGGASASKRAKAAKRRTNGPKAVESVAAKKLPKNYVSGGGKQADPDFLNKDAIRNEPGYQDFLDMQREMVKASPEARAAFMNQVKQARKAAQIDHGPDPENGEYGRNRAAQRRALHLEAMAEDMGLIKAENTRRANDQADAIDDRAEEAKKRNDQRRKQGMKDRKAARDRAEKQRAEREKRDQEAQRAAEREAQKATAAEREADREAARRAERDKQEQALERAASEKAAARRAEYANWDDDQLAEAHAAIMDKWDGDLDPANDENYDYSVIGQRERDRKITADLLDEMDDRAAERAGYSDNRDYNTIAEKSQGHSAAELGAAEQEYFDQIAGDRQAETELRDYLDQARQAHAARQAEYKAELDKLTPPEKGDRSDEAKAYRALKRKHDEARRLSNGAKKKHAALETRMRETYPDYDRPFYHTDHEELTELRDALDSVQDRDADTEQLLEQVQDELRYRHPDELDGWADLSIRDMTNLVKKYGHDLTETQIIDRMAMNGNDRERVMRESVAFQEAYGDWLRDIMAEYAKGWTHKGVVDEDPETFLHDLMYSNKNDGTNITAEQMLSNPMYARRASGEARRLFASLGFLPSRANFMRTLQGRAPKDYSEDRLSEITRKGGNATRRSKTRILLDDEISAAADARGLRGRARSQFMKEERQRRAQQNVENLRAQDEERRRNQAADKPADDTAQATTNTVTTEDGREIDMSTIPGAGKDTDKGMTDRVKAILAKQAAQRAESDTPESTAEKTARENGTTPNTENVTKAVAKAEADKPAKRGRPKLNGPTLGEQRAEATREQTDRINELKANRPATGDPARAQWEYDMATARIQHAEAVERFERDRMASLAAQNKPLTSVKKNIDKAQAAQNKAREERDNALAKARKEHGDDAAETIRTTGGYVAPPKKKRTRKNNADTTGNNTETRAAKDTPKRDTWANRRDKYIAAEKSRVDELKADKPERGTDEHKQWQRDYAQAQLDLINKRIDFEKKRKAALEKAGKSTTQPDKTLETLEQKRIVAEGRLEKAKGGDFKQGPKDPETGKRPTLIKLSPETLAEMEKEQRDRDKQAPENAGTPEQVSEARKQLSAAEDKYNAAMRAAETARNVEPGAHQTNTPRKKLTAQITVAEQRANRSELSLEALRADVDRQTAQDNLDRLTGEEPNERGTQLARKRADKYAQEVQKDRDALDAARKQLETFDANYAAHNGPETKYTDATDAPQTEQVEYNTLLNTGEKFVRGIGIKPGDTITVTNPDGTRKAVIAKEIFDDNGKHVSATVQDLDAARAETADMNGSNGLQGTGATVDDPTKINPAEIKDGETLSDDGRKVTLPNGYIIERDTKREHGIVFGIGYRVITPRGEKGNLQLNKSLDDMREAAKRREKADAKANTDAQDRRLRAPKAQNRKRAQKAMPDGWTENNNVYTAPDGATVKHQSRDSDPVTMEDGTKRVSRHAAEVYTITRPDGETFTLETIYPHAAFYVAQSDLGHEDVDMLGDRNLAVAGVVARTPLMNRESKQPGSSYIDIEGYRLIPDSFGHTWSAQDPNLDQIGAPYMTLNAARKTIARAYEKEHGMKRGTSGIGEDAAAQREQLANAARRQMAAVKKVGGQNLNEDNIDDFQEAANALRDYGNMLKKAGHKDEAKGPLESADYMQGHIDTMRRAPENMADDNAKEPADMDGQNGLQATAPETPATPATGETRDRTDNVVTFRRINKDEWGVTGTDLQVGDIVTARNRKGREKPVTITEIVTDTDGKQVARFEDNKARKRAPKRDAEQAANNAEKPTRTTQAQPATPPTLPEGHDPYTGKPATTGRAPENEKEQRKLDNFLNGKWSDFSDRLAAKRELKRMGLDARDARDRERDAARAAYKPTTAEKKWDSAGLYFNDMGAWETSGYMVDETRLLQPGETSDEEYLLTIGRQEVYVPAGGMKRQVNGKVVVNGTDMKTGKPVTTKSDEHGRFGKPLITRYRPTKFKAAFTPQNYHAKNDLDRKYPNRPNAGMTPETAREAIKRQIAERRINADPAMSTAPTITEREVDEQVAQRVAHEDTARNRTVIHVIDNANESRTHAGGRLAHYIVGSGDSYYTATPEFLKRSFFDPDVALADLNAKLVDNPEARIHINRDGDLRLAKVDKIESFNYGYRLTGTDEKGDKFTEKVSRDRNELDVWLPLTHQNGQPYTRAEAEEYATLQGRREAAANANVSLVPEQIVWGDNERRAADAALDELRKRGGELNFDDADEVDGLPDTPAPAPQGKRHKKGTPFTTENLKEGETLDERGNIVRGDFKIISTGDGYRYMETGGNERMSKNFTSKSLDKMRKDVDALTARNPKPAAPSIDNVYRQWPDLKFQTDGNLRLMLEGEDNPERAAAIRAVLAARGGLA